MVTKLVKGTDVIDLTDGTTLGVIDAVYLDPERREIVGFAFHRGGLLGGRFSGLVDIDDVRAFGPDAVVVAGGLMYDEPAIAPEGKGLVELDDLIKRRVLSEDGAALGRIAAVRFAEGSHRLVGLEVEPDGLPYGHILIDAEQIATIGTDVVMVREPAVEPRAATAAPPVRLVRSERGGRIVA